MKRPPVEPYLSPAGNTVELKMLLCLATMAPGELANRVGLSDKRGIIRWMHTLADRLDRAGYRGGALRALLARPARRPRIINFTDLQVGRDRDRVLEVVPAKLVKPVPCDPRRVRGAVQALRRRGWIPASVLDA